jgi:hypothetical protein
MTLGAESSTWGGLDRRWRADRIALLLPLTLILLVAVRWHNYQWDFYMFFGSANDFSRGLSPYIGKGLSFYHPPLTLYLYDLFTHLPFVVAYELWFALKLAALSGLFLLWSRHFIKLEWSWVTILYFVLAYNGTIYSDLVAGNVSLFEQFALWLGFAALLQGRYAVFCVCIALLSQFKLTPIFFSAALLVATPRPQWKWFAVCCAGFAALFSLNFVLQPELARAFFTVAPVLDERGTLAPGTLAFARDVVDRIAGGHASDASHADELMYLLAAATVGVVSLVAVLRHRKAGVDPKSVLYFLCVAYTLAAPRMRAYSYVLLLIPTLHLLRVLPRKVMVPVATAVLAIMVVLPLGTTLLPFRSAFQLLYEYLPLLAALGVWLGFRNLLGSSAAPILSRQPIAPSPQVSSS